MQVTVKGIEFDVEYQLHGTYLPATRYEPEEFPELGLVSATSASPLLEIVELVTFEDIHIEVETAIRNGEN